MIYPFYYQAFLYLDVLYLCWLKLMSSTQLIYPLIVVFDGNNPLVKLQLLLHHIYKIIFSLRLGVYLLYYAVSLRLYLLHSVVLVDCNHHFHVIYFPVMYGFCYLSRWIIVFRMLVISVLGITDWSTDVCNCQFHFHWIISLRHHFLIHIDLLGYFVSIAISCSSRISNCIHFCI